MTQTCSPIPKSSVHEIQWPALPTPHASAHLALQQQLSQSQWWPSNRLQEEQYRQLDLVLNHAMNIPFYQERLQGAGYEPTRAPITPEIFQHIPLLRRQNIQDAAESLQSPQTPKGHGKNIEHRTSGSSGRPIQTLGTGITQFFWDALTLRDHLWHIRDFSGKLAAIRSNVTSGRGTHWGGAAGNIYQTGPGVLLNISTDISSQIDWLMEENPHYLLSHPSNIKELIRFSQERGVTFANLKEVRSFGETVTTELRQLCDKVLRVPLVDTYSAQEIGYIALQCPQEQHYHIQSENVLVEVLNEENMPCSPGEIGRVVITTLHNFAMPLIRYEILDYAQVGNPCPCGRGLPVLNKILGRQRNLVSLPDGTKHWPSFPSIKWASVAPILQLQLVQKSLDHVLARLAVREALTEDQEQKLVSVFQDCLGHPFTITFEYHEEIERKPNSKYEDFISELTV